MANLANQGIKDKETHQISGNWFGHSFSRFIWISGSLYYLVPKHDGLEANECQGLRHWWISQKHLATEDAIRIISPPDL